MKQDHCKQDTAVWILFVHSCDEDERRDTWISFPLEFCKILRYCRAEWGIKLQTTDRWTGTFMRKEDLHLWSSILTIFFKLFVFILFLQRGLYPLFPSMPYSVCLHFRCELDPLCWSPLGEGCPAITHTQHQPAPLHSWPNRANKTMGSLNVCQICPHPRKMFYSVQFFPGESMCSSSSAIFINTSHLYSKYLFNFKIYIVSLPTASRWYLQKLKT